MYNRDIILAAGIVWCNSMIPKSLYFIASFFAVYNRLPIYIYIYYRVGMYLATPEREIQFEVVELVTSNDIQL